MFRTRLEVREVDADGKRWELLCRLVYQGNYEKFIVPEGFVTDFASVPRPLWGIVAPWGRHMKAAVLHDWLYSMDSKFIPRSDADGVFRRTMRQLGVGRFRRWTMWAAVRLFGRGRFRR